MTQRDGAQRPLPFPVEELTPADPGGVAYVERSIAAAPLWQMGPSAPQKSLSRRDPNVLDFLASAKRAPLAEIEFDVVAWIITRWFVVGRPADGRLSATFGDLARGLYGKTRGGKQYALIREALDNLYSVSLDLAVVTTERGSEHWLSTRRRRILQELNMRERIRPGAESSHNTIELQLASWLVAQLDAQTVAAIAWQVIRRLTGTAKRLAIYLAAHAGDFEPITAHTARLDVPLTEELYEEFGISAARERDRRASVGRAARRLAEHDPRYDKVMVEPASEGYLLRAERPRGGEVLPFVPRAEPAEQAAKSRTWPASRAVVPGSTG